MTFLNVSLETCHCRLEHPHARLLQLYFNSLFLFLHETNLPFAIHVYQIHLIDNHLHDLLCQVPNLFKSFLVIYGNHPLLFPLKKNYIIKYLLINTWNALGFTLYNWKSTIFQKFCPLMEKHFNSRILSFNIDGVGEFQNLNSYLSCHGINRLITHSYTPQSRSC